MDCNTQKSEVHRIILLTRSGLCCLVRQFHPAGMAPVIRLECLIASGCCWKLQSRPTGGTRFDGILRWLEEAHMAETQSDPRPSIMQLILVPSLFTLAVTILRLVQRA